MDLDQIAAEAADKLSCPPRCSCAGSPYQKDGIRERKKRANIIKAAIGKAFDAGYQKALDDDVERHMNKTHDP